jgi:hypothetical protein
MRASERIFEPQSFSRRTRIRFTARRRAALIAHLGRPVTYPERILISRLIANEWDLRRLDHRLDAGEELSGHAARLRLALENRLRLDLQALGLRPPRHPSADGLLSRRRGRTVEDFLA